MKKTLRQCTVLLILCLLLFVAPKALANSRDICGLWYGNQIVYNETNIDIQVSYQVFSLELCKDGTAALTYQYRNDELIDTVKGTWLITNDKVLFDLPQSGMSSGKVVSDQLYIYCDGTMDIICSKDQPEPFVRPLKKQASSMNEFMGDWYASRIIISGVVLTPKELKAISGKPFNIIFSVSDLARFKRIEEKQDWTRGYIYELSKGSLQIYDGQKYLTIEITDTDELRTNYDTSDLEMELGTVELYLSRVNNLDHYDSAQDNVAAMGTHWECPNCGNLAEGNFCNNCGMKRPANVGADENTDVDTVKSEEKSSDDDKSVTKREKASEDSDIISIIGPFSGRNITVKVGNRTYTLHEEFKTAMDKYVEFFDAYIEFVTHPDTSDYAVRYLDVMQKYTVAMESLDKAEKMSNKEKGWTDDEEAYFSYVLLEINRKLYAAVGSL